MLGQLTSKLKVQSASMSIAFYKISGRSIMPIAWGDYADILQHGMTVQEDGDGGNLSLQRTAPFMPPITLPGIGDLLLTSGARRALESSGLTGFSLRPVKKTHIVELHWEDWDFDADELPEYPESGEPEDLIFERPHSPTAADALGEIWEVVVPTSARILRPRRIVESYRELKIDLSTWNGADLIRGDDYGGILFSERAREAFSERWDLYVQFDQFSTT